MDNKRELSEDQIEQLFAFCRSKYVRYIDVQYEIVDHLASAIEDEMSQDPSLSFKAAVHKVYGRFPVTGFSNLVAQKEKAMTRYWRKKVVAFCKSYLTLPRVILTAVVFLFIGTSIAAFQGKSAVVIGGLLFFYTFIADLKLKELTRKTDTSRYLVLSSFSGVTGSLGLVFIVGVLPQVDISTVFYQLFSGWQILLISLFFTVVFIWAHASFTAFPQMLKEELNHKYSHLGLKLA